MGNLTLNLNKKNKKKYEQKNRKKNEQKKHFLTDKFCSKNILTKVLKENNIKLTKRKEEAFVLWLSERESKKKILGNFQIWAFLESLDCHRQLLFVLNMCCLRGFVI